MRIRLTIEDEIKDSLMEAFNIKYLYWAPHSAYHDLLFMYHDLKHYYRILRIE